MLLRTLVIGSSSPNSKVERVMSKKYRLMVTLVRGSNTVNIQQSTHRRKAFGWERSSLPNCSWTCNCNAGHGHKSICPGRCLAECLSPGSNRFSDRKGARGTGLFTIMTAPCLTSNESRKNFQPKKDKIVFYREEARWQREFIWHKRWVVLSQKGRNRSPMVEVNIRVTVDTLLQLSGLSLRYVE